MRPFVVIASLLLPLPLWADCGGTELLSCPIAGKQTTLELCLDGDTLTYAYGPAGKPDLVLSQPLSAGGYHPWNGIGRSIWETVDFARDGHVYSVFWSVDRLDPTALPEAGVVVLKGDALLVQLTCQNGSDQGDFGSVLSRAMERAGLCWDPTRQTWAPC